MGRHFAFIIVLLLISTNAYHLSYAQHHSEVPTAPQSRESSVVTLSFKEFFELERGELKPSARLLALNGKHVRLIGFMVQMENTPSGAFYLCEHPIFCDEEGGGTADLPPESVLVLVSSYSGKTISFIPGALEVTGTLEYGRKEGPDDQISFIRLILDKPTGAPVPLNSQPGRSR